VRDFLGCRGGGISCADPEWGVSMKIQSATRLFLLLMGFVRLRETRRLTYPSIKNPSQAGV
jgi:hypothetical protein